VETRRAPLVGVRTRRQIERTRTIAAEASNSILTRPDPVLPSAFMAKFKAARGRRSSTPARPPAAVSCVVLILVGMVLVMLFMYEVMKHANG
jgi:hypothetical protein